MKSYNDLPKFIIDHIHSFLPYKHEHNKKFKGYYLHQNCGYGTKKHLKAIKYLGITSHHRKTFSPINKIK